jgi:L-threonylcarbamoyladenylate synthase
MRCIQTVDEARVLLDKGEVIAYPTEAVYGLGCDPFNKAAVEQILYLKQRSREQGLIVLIADWAQLWPLIADVPEIRLDAVKRTWPGAVTWVFPKSEQVPSWLTGKHESIAIRMTAHPVARALCQEGPIISTSANISGTQPLRDMQAVSDMFPDVDILVGNLGSNVAPSALYHVLEGTQLR